MLELETIKGKIESVIYFNQSNSYSILIVNYENKKIIAKGIFPQSDVLPAKGEKSEIDCTFKGQWINDVKYNIEFEFQSSEIESSGMLFFLKNMAKVSPEMAEKIFKKFGNKNLGSIIIKEPERLLEIKGMRKKTLKRIKETWNKYSYLKQMIDFFAKQNIFVNNSVILKIYDYFFTDENGKTIIDPDKVLFDIKQNPYILTKIEGIGFKTADKLASQLGIDELSDVRLDALISYVLFSVADDQGHTYLLFPQLIEYVKETIQQDTDIDKLSEKIKQKISSEGKFYYDKERGIVALKGYKNKEEFIFNDLLDRLSKKTNFYLNTDEAVKFIEKEEEHLKLKLSKGQYDAILSVVTNQYRVFLLCGYAGTGKSTISKSILDFYSSFVDYSNITCCAFTGMASKRVKDTTGYNSTTIHSLLGWDGNTFFHDENNPIEYDVILIDEASMINLDLFYALIRAIKKESVIIMVGDDAQLPPIGAGNVFSDLMNLEIPRAKLTQIFRQSPQSVLTYFASFIREGEMPPLNLTDNDYKDFKFILKDIPNYFEVKKSVSEEEFNILNNKTKDEILDTTIDQVKLLSEMIESYEQRIWNIQVITPMKNTVIGTIRMNEVLQNILNPNSPSAVEIKHSQLKIYDKVIHLKNKSMKVMKAKDFLKHSSLKILSDMMDDEELVNSERIYNGSIGLVLAIDSSDEIFAVQYPDIGKIVFYDFSDYKDIVDLGYALTIHKVQGNQFEYVVMPIANSFYKMLNNKLTYTALTRARKKVIIIGQQYAFKRGCTNKGEMNRQTFLALKKVII